MHARAGPQVIAGPLETASMVGDERGACTTLATEVPYIPGMAERTMVSQDVWGADGDHTDVPAPSTGAQQEACPRRMHPSVVVDDLLWDLLSQGYLR